MHTSTYTVTEWDRERERRWPENLLDEQTPYGLVSVTMPNSSDAFVRSWPWPRHLLSHRFLLSSYEREREKRQSQIVLLPLLSLPNSIISVWERERVSCQLVRSGSFRFTPLFYDFHGPAYPRVYSLYSIGLQSNKLFLDYPFSRDNKTRAFTNYSLCW